MNSDVSIVVDGVPRHVRDLRKATAHDEVGQEDACDDDLVGFTYDSDDTACDQGSDGGDESSDYGGESSDCGDESSSSSTDASRMCAAPLRQSVWDRRPPTWLRDFYYDS